MFNYGKPLALPAKIIDMKSFSLLSAVLVLAFLFSCRQTDRQATEIQASQTDTLKAPAITVSPFTDTAGLTLFPEASLSYTGKTGNIKAGLNEFRFAVKGFSLGAQTPDTSVKLCANSAKGQHIHYIMDNKPYVAQYSPVFTDSLSEGHHVMLAFLSRSYHESLKQSKAYVLKEFCAGKNCTDNFDEKAPHLFFSRPKGEYNGSKETNRLLLDFYLLNCELSDTGYHVRATINGNEFMLYRWVPYMIEGLPAGELTVKLELLDAQGQLVSSPFNATERKVKLLPDPLK